MASDPVNASEGDMASVSVNLNETGHVLLSEGGLVCVSVSVSMVSVTSIHQYCLNDAKCPIFEDLFVNLFDKIVYFHILTFMKVGVNAVVQGGLCDIALGLQ